MKKKIVLLGYMGSGKTTIGKILAEELNIPFYDLDLFIENKEKNTVKNIFETHGELYFRKKEHFYINELLSLDVFCVISLGGGTPCYANNHLHFEKEEVHSFYLKGSIQILMERLSTEIDSRPLLSRTEDDLSTFIAKHLFDRSYFYNKAQSKINIDAKSVSEIVTEIKNTLI